MNRRQFFATSAALIAVTACEQRRVRLWLTEFEQDEIPWQHMDFNGLWRESAKSGYNVPFGLNTSSTSLMSIIRQTKY